MKEIEAYEAEMRAPRDKRDDQQAQAPPLTFSELQRTMDPAIAADVYNKRFCPLLSRLPPEILLCISDFLRDDLVALFCLRIVSKTFLHLLSNHKDIWGHKYPDRSSLSLSGTQSAQFRQLIQSDGRCGNCKRWYDARKPLMRDTCQFQPMAHEVVDYELDQRMIHCYACDSFHDIFKFPSLYQQPLQHQTDRRCLGQQGSVQLCEHIYITWARIKAHIDDWRQQQKSGGKDWRACLDSFNIECHDAVHDTRCTALEAPTWPQARLGISRFIPDLVVLDLKWTPHRRIDSIKLTTDGRMPVTELRALFHGLRALGPADTLYPASCRNALPEMMFFSPSSLFGPFVYYKTGEDDKIGPLSTSSRPLPSHWLDSWNGYYGGGTNGKDLRIDPHYIRDATTHALSSQCLVVRYKKDILICSKRAIMDPDVRIVPTHQWLHAMDTQTYPHPQASHVRPQCRDITCVNYYRRRKDFCLRGGRRDGL